MHSRLLGAAAACIVFGALFVALWAIADGSAGGSLPALRQAGPRYVSGLHPAGEPPDPGSPPGGQPVAGPGPYREPLIRDFPLVRRGLATEDILMANERRALSADAPQARVPLAATILVVPIEFAASETLAYQVHNEDGSECITVTGTFEGPMHGEIGYPGGSAARTIDNQTVYYPSTEPDDYARLIFGREGLTVPLRAGDPNINDGAGVDISGLTVQSYFDAQSDGTVEITGTVAPWVPLPHSEAYFGIDRCAPGFSSRSRPDEQLAELPELVVGGAEALKSLGGEYATHEFWSRFDRDGDSFVDSLWIIHSGRGQEYGGGAQGEEALWSRASALMAYAGFRAGYVIHDNDTPSPDDDIRLGAFTVLPEDSDIGVLIEEFGHSYFGLPDLYTIDLSNSVGWWAPMSAGIYGGELDGTRPVNMPLWFRQVADCNGAPCGWADPVKVLSYTTPAETVILGQAGAPSGGLVEGGPYEGSTIYEGLRIDLPPQVEQAPNRAGAGGGAYSGTKAGVHNTLTRELDLSDATGPITLTFSSHWRIPYIFGYGYLEVAGEGEDFTTQPDLGGHFTDEDPMGVNDGWGLTRDGEGRLEFDLSEYAGQAIAFRLRYFTYSGVPGSGWWVDDLTVAAGKGGGGVVLLDDDFEAGLDDWMVTGWRAVPYELTHSHYYLVEWRNDNGFDKSLRTAFAVNYASEGERRVDRIPANVPGALVTYRNLKYPLSGTLEDQLTDPPSLGPKYGLLVIDTNYWPVMKGGTSLLGGAAQSLDAALALQSQPDYVLEHRNPATGNLTRTETISGSRGVTRLDDALGYYPGYRAQTASPMGAEAWVVDASVVIPSRDDAFYSTRITWGDRSRPHPLDGVSAGNGHYFGSGNPGAENAQLGVHVEVVDQSPDGSWGAVRVFNAAVDYELTAASLALPGHDSAFGVAMVNRGAVTTTVAYTVTLPEGLKPLDEELVWSGEVGPGQTVTGSYGVRIPADADASVGPFVASAVFDDGTDLWVRTAEMAGAARLYCPLLVHGELGSSPEP